MVVKPLPFHCPLFDLPYGCSMLQKGVLAIRGGILAVMAIMGESTLSPSKICSHKNRNFAFGFFGYM